MTAESLDALCNHIRFTNVKHYLHSFYKVQELRDDFLHRKLKELCEERALLKSMNASEPVPGPLSPEEPNTPGVPKVDPAAPGDVGETGIVIRKPSHRASDEGTCDANQRYQQETCEASHAEFLELQKRTTTLYSERPMMILPSDEYGGANAMFSPEDGTDQYFQIVLPVKNIKIINGMNSREFTPRDGEFGGDWAEDDGLHEPGNRSLGLGRTGGRTGGMFGKDHHVFTEEAFNGRTDGRGYMEISCKSYDINYI